MGGFSSFQKRFGDATIANQTLDVAKETLAAIKEGNFPDIHKMAKMFAPDVELIPVVKYWSLEERIAGGIVNFDGRYFGIFKVYHNNLDVAGSNNKYCRSIAMLHDGDSIVLKSAINIHGDDILSWPNNELEHVGYGTAASIHMNGQSFPRHDLYISFVGFKLGEALPIILEPLNYNNLTGVPFTINGEVIETLNVGVHNGLLSGQSISIGVEGQAFKVNGVSVLLGETYNTIFDSNVVYLIEKIPDTFTITKNRDNNFVDVFLNEVKYTGAINNTGSLVLKPKIGDEIKIVPVTNGFYISTLDHINKTKYNPMVYIYNGLIREVDVSVTVAKMSIANNSSAIIQYSNQVSPDVKTNLGPGLTQAWQWVDHKVLITGDFSYKGVNNNGVDLLFTNDIPEDHEINDPI